MPMPDTKVTAADPLVPVGTLGVGEVFIDNADGKPYCVLGPDPGGGMNLAAVVRDWFSKIDPAGCRLGAGRLSGGGRVGQSDLDCTGTQT
jgi:hypothetical protein